MIQIQTAQSLPIKFKLGATLLDDPAPHESLAKKQELLAQQFPQLRFTHIYESDAVIESGTKVYPILVPPPKVNG
ncbi:hypothetical protein IC617_08340 [Neiella sp. HB171785]|uniref:Uncharacterized protein n=1 Tax=Neiella litorisoli TaxID=2771431 RepID=A0A8J6UIY1_9GAMM|nr:hypothetical protein [Neiella litorisoli]MBD1389433.1 hypothetical protein [Neiella litorisoli]